MAAVQSPLAETSSSGLGGHQDKHRGPPARRAGRAHPVRIHVRKRRDEIDGPDAVPQMHAHRRSDAPETLTGIFPVVRHLVGVVLSDHVVAEHDEALPGETDGSARH